MCTKVCACVHVVWYMLNTLLSHFHKQTCYLFLYYRRLLPVQMNLDEHDPQFCIDNFNRIATNNSTLANQLCPVGPDAFSGAPPSVSMHVTDTCVHDTVNLFLYH